MSEARPRSRRTARPVVVAFAALAVLLLAGSNALGTENLVWRLQVVSDDADGTGDQPGFAIRQDGRAFASWNSDGRLYVAEMYLGIWTPPVMLNASSTAFPSLAIDTAGEPHIAFANVNDLVHASRSGGAWSFEIVDSAGSTGWYSDIEIDGQDRIHIIYSRVNTPNQVRYALKDENGWRTELLSSDSDGTSDTDITLGPGNIPHATFGAYHNPEGLRTVHVWKPDNSPWLFEVVGNCGDSGIAVGAQGDVHVSCNDNGPHTLYYHKTGTGWTREALDTGTPPVLNGKQGEYTSIVVDAMNRPHIGYLSHICNPQIACNHVRYSTKSDDGTWISTEVDPSGIAANGGPTLRIDRWGVPRMLYHYERDQVANVLWYDLRYAEPLAAIPGGFPCVTCA